MDVTVEVYRSGSTYLVRRGDLARTVAVLSAQSAYVSDVARVQAILAHSNVQEPWVKVAPGETLPAVVERLRAKLEG